MNQTGAESMHIIFNNLEDRIIALCGKQNLDGDSVVPEIGFKNPTSAVGATDLIVDIDSIIDIESIDVDESSSASSNRSLKRKFSAESKCKYTK